MRGSCIYLILIALVTLNILHDACLAEGGTPRAGVEGEYRSTLRLIALEGEAPRLEWLDTLRVLLGIKDRGRDVLRLAGSIELLHQRPKDVYGELDARFILRPFSGLTITNRLGLGKEPDRDNPLDDYRSREAGFDISWDVAKGAPRLKLRADWNEHIFPAKPWRSYEDRSWGLGLRWPLTGHVSVLGEVGCRDRSYYANPVNNSQGISGEVEVRYRPWNPLQVVCFFGQALRDYPQRAHMAYDQGTWGSSLRWRISKDMEITGSWKNSRKLYPWASHKDLSRRVISLELRSRPFGGLDLSLKWSRGSTAYPNAPEKDYTRSNLDGEARIPIGKGITFTLGREFREKDSEGAFLDKAGDEGDPLLEWTRVTTAGVTWEFERGRKLTGSYELREDSNEEALLGVRVRSIYTLGLVYKF